ncbi:hypothetical protein H310_15061, partial [Aphanomyces invadans]
MDAAGGQTEGYSMQSAPPHYQNYGKLTWDRGEWTAEILTKQYDDVPETILQPLLTWDLDFRAVTSRHTQAVGVDNMLIVKAMGPSDAVASHNKY